VRETRGAPVRQPHARSERPFSDHVAWRSAEGPTVGSDSAQQRGKEIPPTHLVAAQIGLVSQYPDQMKYRETHIQKGLNKIKNPHKLNLIRRDVAHTPIPLSVSKTRAKWQKSPKWTKLTKINPSKIQSKISKNIRNTNLKPIKIYSFKTSEK